MDNRCLRDQQQPQQQQQQQRPNEKKEQQIESFDPYGCHGTILSREQSEEMLNGQSDGTFVIRKSDHAGLVLSIQYRNDSFHIKIKNRDNRVYLTDARQFSSIDEMISYYATNGLGRSFPAVPVKLTQLLTQMVKVTEDSSETTTYYNQT